MSRAGLAFEEPKTRRSRRAVALPSFLRPYLDRLKVSTTVVESAGKSLVGADIESPPGTQVTVSGPTCSFVDEFIFRTEGPPGDTTLSPIASSHDADPGLDTLERYVREVLPARGAPAVYRAYDISVGFGADYVAKMYASNSQSLVIALRSAQGEIVSVANSMGPGHEIVLRREEKAWMSTLERSSCQLTVAESLVVRETQVTAELPPGDPLLPRTRYDAALQGKQPGKTESVKPLYQWSFVSSAFLNFADHFQLKGAVRSAQIVGLTGMQWLGLASPSLLAGDPWSPPDAERSTRRSIEIEVFEALMNSVDVADSLPETLELLAIANGTSTWGILLSSPEPFDWDRLTLTVKRGYFKSSAGCLGSFLPFLQWWATPVWVDEQQGFRALRNADGTRAFIVLMTGGGVVDFQPGDFTLAGTFRRDIGGGLPVLTERGSSTDEKAEIKWTLPVP
jgi:hypothetical protein